MCRSLSSHRSPADRSSLAKIGRDSNPCRGNLWERCSTPSARKRPVDKPNDKKQPKGQQRRQDNGDGSPQAESPQGQSEQDRKERHFKLGLREVIAAVISGVIVLVIAIVVFHDKGSPGGVSEPPRPPRPPAAQQAKDDAVPDTMGAVHERVWAPEAQTFAEPFKLQGAGLPIPHNQDVLVSCKLYWPHPESVEEEGYWYRIITKPWKALFSPANSFWNGDKPGRKPTHSTDYRVRNCRESELPKG